MLARAETALRVAEKSYRAGAISLLELLEAQRTYLDTRAQYLRALYDFRQAAVDVTHAVGEHDRHASDNHLRWSPPSRLSLRAAGCTKSHGGARRPARGREAARLHPLRAGHAPLDFIKIETVAGAVGRDRGSLPGQVTFDEDHTQRVASPIDGRAVGDPGQARATGCRRGSRWSSCRRPTSARSRPTRRRRSSDLALAEKSIERVHKLQADGAVAEKEVAQVEADLRKARSDVARADARSCSRWACRPPTRR